MILSDIELLARKILVGVVVTAVPALILVGGLWATQHLLQTHAPAAGATQKGTP